MAFQVSDVPAAVLHVPAQRAVLAARHRGDDRGLPQEDAGGDRPRNHVQRPQGLRALDLGSIAQMMGRSHKSKYSLRQLSQSLLRTLEKTSRRCSNSLILREGMDGWTCLPCANSEVHNDRQEVA